MGVSIINLLVPTNGVSVLVGSIQLSSPTGKGFQDMQNNSQILLCASLDGELGPCPKAAALFLWTVVPRDLHPLPSLINSCLNLAIGTQGRSWRLNEAYFL